MSHRILIGLGSNIGDRLLNLRTALTHLNNNSRIRVHAISPVYHSQALLTEHAPSAWQSYFLNAVIAIRSTYSPHELLAELKRIEERMGRSVHHEKWSPRIIDLDLLVYDQIQLHDEHLTLPHPEFKHRPFVLWPMSDVLPDWCDPSSQKTVLELATPLGSRFSGNAPFQTKQIPHRLQQPILMGIINVTPDSFSDGGMYIDEHQALEHAKQLIATGAEYVDIGAESTRPRAQLIDAQEDWQRLEPILKLIHEKKGDFLIAPKISLDSRHVTSLQKAMEFGLTIINKVDGYRDEASLDFLKQSGKSAVLMHQCGIPADPNRILNSEHTPIQHLHHWFSQECAFLEKNGVDPHRLILDPGLGFGKHAQHSVNILAHLKELHAFNKELLIGHSRKSFFSLFDDVPAADRDVHTAILSGYLTQQAVSFLRVHDVASTRLAVNIQLALKQV